jgi:hypothetical protein
MRKWPVSKIFASIPEWDLGNMTVWRTNWEESTNMEPMNSVSYYLEFQRQLAASKGSSQKPLGVPADQQLNLLRAGQALVGLGAIDRAEMKPPGGGDSLLAASGKRHSAGSEPSV